RLAEPGGERGERRRHPATGECEPGALGDGGPAAGDHATDVRADRHPAQGAGEAPRCLAGQGDEPEVRPAMHRRGGTRCLRGLLAGLVLSLGAIPGAWAGDWENMRDSFDDRLRPHARRLTEIDAKEQGDPPDRVQRAEKITRERIARLTALLKRGGKIMKGLGDAAAVGSGEASALATLSQEQAEQVDAVLREWGGAGSE